MYEMFAGKTILIIIHMLAARYVFTAIKLKQAKSVYVLKFHK